MPDWRVFAVGLALSLGVVTGAMAQAVTPDLFNPTRDGYAPEDQSPLRKTPSTNPPANPAVAKDRAGTQAANGTDPNAPPPDQPKPAPSRIGKIPTFDQPAAAGASDSGFDSLNRKRQKDKFYPAQPKPKIVGPGNKPLPPPLANAPLTVAPSSTANKNPVSASVNGTFPGQPPRRRLKPDDDPFGNVGDYVGSFLVKEAVEVSGGYDSNPGRLNTARSAPLYVIAPEFLAASDWSRHSLIADLRGSYTGYSETFPAVNGVFSPLPTNADRPDFTGKIDGRLDVTRDTRINGEARLRVSTDNPGSPSIQAGLSKYPLFATSGGTLGLEQDFNRLQISGNALVDRTDYQQSQLTDGTSSSNDDRNFTQYGGNARVSYDLLPGVKPFGDVAADTRVHDLNFDRFGYQRDSNGGTVRAGTTFELTRLLTGDIAVGYALRSYQDARLTQLSGVLTSASLVWNATGLTTVKFNATSSIDESTLPGVSGVFNHDYVVEVDHAFRRWLIGTGKLGYGTSDYGPTRFDNRYFAEADLVYKLNRTFQIKGSVRQEWLDSSVSFASSQATIFMLGVRVQR